MLIDFTFTNLEKSKQSKIDIKMKRRQEDEEILKKKQAHLDELVKKIGETSTDRHCESDKSRFISCFIPLILY